MSHLHDVATGGNHILVEFDAIEIGIAPIHIGLTVIINKHGRVDVVPVLFLPDERFAQRIDKGTVGRVGHQHADTVAVDGTIHIPLSVAFHHAFGPGTIVALVPLEVTQRGHRAVILPVDHVGGRVEQPVAHLEALGIVLVVGGIEIDGVAVDIRSRVGGVLGLDDRHVQVMLRPCHRTDGTGKEE